MLIRNSSPDDLDKITELESICFPPKEAATRKDFEKRLEIYSNHFLLLFDGYTLVSLVGGLCSDDNDLIDEMYENADLHNENGDWQMIFSVITHPDYRKKGFASKLLKHFIDEAESQNRLGVVLTCKEYLVDYYSGFGFADEGISEKSQHAGEIWHQMRLKFK